MAKILVPENGKILIPEHELKYLALEPGTELVVEHLDHGLALHPARADLQNVYLEVTTRCNFDCAMCVRHAWKDPQGRMSQATFTAVLAGLQAFPDLKRVYFGGYGEPLTHPQIVEMVAQLHALGLGITMTTNALLLKKPLAKRLFEAGLDTLVVSLDSMHLQAYRNVRGDLEHNQVLSNIQGVQELIQDSGFKLPALGLEFVVTRSNLEEFYQIPEIAKQVGAQFVIVTNLLPHTPELANEVLYDRDRPLQLGGGWGIHRAGWIAWGVPRLPRMKWGARRRCRFINEPGLVIGWDGGVSPCYALMHSYLYYMYGRRKEVTRYLLGSVNEKPLKEIWTSEEYVLFRAKVRDFRFPSCVECGIDCSYAQENSDCWGNEPSCADCLWAQDILLCP